MEKIREVCRQALEKAGYPVEVGEECENAVDLEVAADDGTIYIVTVLRDD